MTEDDRQRTRRRLLSGAAVAATIGIAGCASGGSEGETDDPGVDDTEQTDPSGSGSSVETTQVDVPADASDRAAAVLGDPESDVVVRVFEDYACPHCRDYSLEVYPDLASQFVDSGEVRYEFHDFPIPVSEQSRPAANAARAVAEAVDDAAYADYAKGLFENQRDLGLDTYESLANDVEGADPATVRSAAAEEAHSEAVQADRQLGEAMALQGTPGVYVGDARIDGATTVETIASVIEDAR